MQHWGLLKKFLGFNFILFFLFNYQLFPQSGYDKIGGVCFRFDDYHDPTTRVIPYINIFTARDLRCTYAVNFGINIVTPEFLSMVQQMQTQGFEIADHTPDHNTRYFEVQFPDTTIYQGITGVDHIFDNVDDARICLEWDSVKTDTYIGEGLINISGNTVTSVNNNEFTNMELPHTMDPYSMDAIYIPSLNKLFKFDPANVTGNEITGLRSFWDEDNVNLTSNNVEYHKVGQDDVFLNIDGIKTLAIRTQQFCDSNGITRPTIWIQPGGYHPDVYRACVKEALKPMGYTAAALFADPVPIKLYNSYDPNDDNRYGMDWEDFNEEHQTLAQVKKIIADNFARHRLSINQSHLSPESGTFAAYLQKTADILDWCLEKGIPIKSYSDWAQLLFKTPQNPYVNVMPSIDVDLDADTHPDGFATHQAVVMDGQSGVFTKSFSKNGNGLLCSLYDLGGVEKGENYFGIWIEGNGQIEVYIRPVDPGEWQSYTFTSSGTNWAYYNCTFQIPDTCSEVCNIEMYSANTSGNIRIGGFELRKNSSNHTLKVFLEGPYNGSAMNTSLYSLGVIPLTQPYSAGPWSYAGAESVSSIPSDIVDWIFLDLRVGPEANTIVGRRAAFLKNDGTVVDLYGINPVSFPGVPDGNYYLCVHHRNHLSIMSSSSLPFSDGNIATDYDFTTGQNKAYGTSAMKNLVGGSYGMCAGDANGDGTINATDLNSYWIPQNGTTYQYLLKTSDFNSDGSINATDLNDFWIPNNGKSTQVP